jgi:hypothetical protein
MLHEDTILNSFILIDLEEPDVLMSHSERNKSGSHKPSGIIQDKTIRPLFVVETQLKKTNEEKQKLKDEKKIKKQLSLEKASNKKQVIDKKKHSSIAIKDELIDTLTDNFSKILSIEVLEKNGLYWGVDGKKGNGMGDRWHNARFNYSVVYGSTKKAIKHYSENDDDVIPKEELDKFLEMNSSLLGGSNIVGIFCHSLRTNIPRRNIREDIKKVIRLGSCVSCGSSTDIICDHKNDLYNDPRVENPATQCLDDFQPLCNHCNLQKRQVCKDEVKNQHIYSAKNFKKFQMYDTFPWEKTTYDINDINTKVGTYWYDPVEFHKNIYKYFVQREPYPILS